SRACDDGERGGRGRPAARAGELAAGGAIEPAKQRVGGHVTGELAALVGRRQHHDALPTNSTPPGVGCGQRRLPRSGGRTRASRRGGTTSGSGTPPDHRISSAEAMTE